MTAKDSFSICLILIYVQIMRGKEIIEGDLSYLKYLLSLKNESLRDNSIMKFVSDAQQLCSKRRELAQQRFLAEKTLWKRQAEEQRREAEEKADQQIRKIANLKIDNVPYKLQSSNFQHKQR